MIGSNSHCGPVSLTFINKRYEFFFNSCQFITIRNISVLMNLKFLSICIIPGNYADRKKFEVHEYTDVSYCDELARIKEKFVPLIDECKRYGTAMRIGTNHGSLSDRILSRYGDTPLGMVESADSTIPNGVSPYRLKILSEREP